MIVSAEKVLAGSGMGPVGEDSAAPQQSTSDPDAGWKGGRPWVHSGVSRFQTTYNASKFLFHAEPRRTLAT